MPGHTIMLQGTASDVGKSLLTAALCRIFRQDGYAVAPFKSQNMSNNSYVTPDGKEIGRAQGMQADACQIQASTDMNPILLKPSHQMQAQVVVHGRVYRNLSARAYREQYLPVAEGIVREALQRLRDQYEIVVLEGAGSPAEVNLKDRDIVNMRLAAWADAPVLLVADIDRGGVFASLVGTMEILTPEERQRVVGFIINKFRGDVSLLQPGLDWLEARTGKPVVGVVPYLDNLALEDEDSLSLDGKIMAQSTYAAQADQLDIAIVRFPKISNFTDFDPLRLEPHVHLRYLTRPEQWGQPDVVVLPGSKSTMDDLLFLRESGLAERLAAYVRQGGRVVGLCGGFQMLGERLHDPLAMEHGSQTAVRGLGYLPLETTFAAEKTTRRIHGRTIGAAAALPIEAYEIHMGHTVYGTHTLHPFRIRHDEQEVAEGAATPDGRIWGCYLHGLFHNDDFRLLWLNELRAAKGWPAYDSGLRYGEQRERAFDRLADHVRRHVDIPLITQWIRGGV